MTNAIKGIRDYSIAILGGTGKEGKGLAYRWAKAGLTVIIGSRDHNRARATAVDICQMVGINCFVSGATNEKAAQCADIVVITVPFAYHQDFCREISSFVQGKIVIDVTVPLVPPKITTVHIPESGGAAIEAQKIFGENVQVVSAFQNISYDLLIKDEKIFCDVLVCGGDKLSSEIVLQLVNIAGLVGWDAGPIENSIVVEGMTSILLGINKKYRVRSAGIRITGVQSDNV